MSSQFHYDRIIHLSLAAEGPLSPFESTDSATKGPPPSAYHPRTGARTLPK